jgi:hypothetical protein
VTERRHWTLLAVCLATGVARAGAIGVWGATVAPSGGSRHPQRHGVLAVALIRERDFVVDPVPASP